MAFTFSHPMMILPIYKANPKKFSLFGLVLGSIIIDLNTFFSFFQVLHKYININNYYSIKALLLFYIPISILIYLLYEYIVKIPLILNLPDRIKGRVQYPNILHKEIESVKTFFVFLYSLLAGMLTHILLDELTHPGTYFSRNFIDLSKKIGIFSIANYLYILTSIIGIIILFYFFMRIETKPIPKTFKVDTTKKIIYWLFILFCAVIMSVLVYQHNNGQVKHLLIGAIKTKDLSTLLGAIRVFIVPFLSGCIIGILLESLFYKVIRFLK